MPATTRTTTRAKVEGVYAQRNVYRHIITYADDITITTTDAKELDLILERVKTCLDRVGLSLSLEKTKLITLNDYEKVSFDYLGFTFLYVPKARIKKGGLLTRNDTITERKLSKKEDGTVLVYPSSNNFDKIKQKTQEIIRELTRNDMITCLNDLNSVIRG